MHFRLVSEVLTSLYVTGTSDSLPGENITDFFAVLEAIEACEDVGEVERLLSLRAQIGPDAVRLPLVGGQVLVGRCEPGPDGSTVIVLEGVELDA